MTEEGAHASTTTTQGTQAIERAITVLRVLATRGRFGWGLTDLAAACGLKKATAHRILSRLESERLVHRQAGSDRYLLGPLLGELSLSIPGFHALAERLRPFTAELAKRYGLVAILSLRSGEHLVVGGRVGTPQFKVELNEVGARRPLTSTAGGIAMMLDLPAAEQQALLQANRLELARRGHFGTGDFDAMWRRSRAAGCGLNLGDIAPGTNAVALPAFGAGRRAFASITFAGSAQELTAQRCRELLPRLREEAARLAELAAQVTPSLYGGIAPGPGPAERPRFI